MCTAEDYLPLNTQLVLDFLNTVQVVPVAIIDDALQENQEFFTATVELGFSDIRSEAIIFENSTATVNILDNNDSKFPGALKPPVHSLEFSAVRFELAPLNTTEGSGPMVGTTIGVVSGQLGRSVMATVTAMAGSAQCKELF